MALATRLYRRSASGGFGTRQRRRTRPETRTAFGTERISEAKKQPGKTPNTMCVEGRRGLGQETNKWTRGLNGAFAFFVDEKEIVFVLRRFGFDAHTNTLSSSAVYG